MRKMGFSKISEKKSQISKNDDGKNPQKFEKIENNITEVEDNFNSNLELLEEK